MGKLFGLIIGLAFWVLLGVNVQFPLVKGIATAAIIALVAIYIYSVIKEKT